MNLNSSGNNLTARSVQSVIGSVLVALFLTACGGDGSRSGSFANGNPVEQSDNGLSTPSADTLQDSGDCTYVLESDINSPTELTNTASYCDYVLEGWVEIRSLLRIQPGVVIRADPDARLVLDGGEIMAIGNEQNRIVFEGASHVQGYWRGIDIRDGRGAIFDFVDVKDAGQVCSILFCPDVGFYVDNIDFSFTNSSVSNSYVHGMSITDDVNIVAFSNNRFFGNALNGLTIFGEGVPALDKASDYLGIGNENGIAAVGIHNGEQTLGRVFEWKDLNAPYFIDGYFNVEGGTLRLEAGVELLFGSEGWMTVEGNGVLQALGTAARPVSIKGYVEQPGYWDGIRFRDSPWDSNQLQYVTMSHSGNIESIVNAHAAINLDESVLTISNSTFSDNDRWGIICNNPEDYPYQASVIYDGGGNRFGRNGAGDLDADCAMR